MAHRNYCDVGMRGSERRNSNRADMMGLLLIPFESIRELTDGDSQHLSEHGLYGPEQESLIRTASRVSWWMGAATPKTHWFGLLSAGVSIGLKSALLADTIMEAAYDESYGSSTNIPKVEGGPLPQKTDLVALPSSTTSHSRKRRRPEDPVLRDPMMSGVVKIPR